MVKSVTYNDLQYNNRITHWHTKQKLKVSRAKPDCHLKWKANKNREYYTKSTEYINSSTVCQQTIFVKKHKRISNTVRSDHCIKCKKIMWVQPLHCQKPNLRMK